MISKIELLQIISELQVRINDLEDVVSRMESGRNVITIPDIVHNSPKNEFPAVFEATSDATWNATSGVLEVTAKALLDDGTLNSHEETIACIGESGDVPIVTGDKCIEVMSADGRRVLEKITGSFTVRGTEAHLKVVMLRAYLTSDDSLVDIGTTYNPSTMYLYPTWDWPRER